MRQEVNITLTLDVDVEQVESVVDINNKIKSLFNDPSIVLISIDEVKEEAEIYSNDSPIGSFINGSYEYKGFVFKPIVDQGNDALEVFYQDKKVHEFPLTIPTEDADLKVFESLLNTLIIGILKSI